MDDERSRVRVCRLQANVETVMASEKGAVQLMNMLDKAVDEISKIDGRLGLYEKKLSVSHMPSLLHDSVHLSLSCAAECG